MTHYPYKTTSNFLCNRKENTKYDGKDWCKVDNFGFSGRKPYLSRNPLNRYYWDTIEPVESEEKCYIYDFNKDNRILRTNTKCCTYETNKTISAGIGLVFIMKLFHNLRHGVEKYQLSSLTNRQLVSRAIKEIANNAPEFESIDNEYINKYITNLGHAETDEEFGIIMKEMFIDYSNNVNNVLKQKGNDVYTSSIQNVAIDYLIEHIPDESFMDVLKGANVLLDDNGDFYSTLQTSSDGYIRFSSHANVAGVPTTSVQYASTSYFYGNKFHVLSGTINVPDKNNNEKTMTWFQFEGSPMPEGSNFGEVTSRLFSKLSEPSLFIDEVENFINHSLDFVVYKTVKNNIGPWGSSEIVDKKPLFISDNPRQYDLKNTITPDLINGHIATLRNDHATIVTNNHINNYIGVEETNYDNIAFQGLIDNPVNHTQQNMYTNQLELAPPAAQLLLRGGKRRSRNQKVITKKLKKTRSRDRV